MIAKLSGQLVEKKENSVVINVQGIYYEVMVPASVMQRVKDTVDTNGNIQLIIYHYIQLSPSSGTPMLIGFLSEIERDFFQKFITVSGIGPRAAVKALNQPISEIAQAIDKGDQVYLKTLPGIGIQKAKEIIAKLQGKVGKYGLIQDRTVIRASVATKTADWQEEALTVLLQLQYKKPEAMDMIRKARRAQQIVREGGFAFGKVFSTCPLNWGLEEARCPQAVAKVVDACLHPLYEIDHGKTTLSYNPEEKGKKISVTEAFAAMGASFAHLTKPDFAALMEGTQKHVDYRWERLKAMSGSSAL